MMKSLTMIGVVAIALLVLVFIWGGIVAPILRRKSSQKRDEKLSKIIAGFKKDDKILLASGIRGYFVKVKNDTLYVEIAKDVIIRVDKHAVMGVYH